MSKPSSTSLTPPPNNTTEEDDNPPPFQTRTTRRRTYYQPSVYQFTCRGAFHLHNTDSQKIKVHDKPSQQKQQNFNDKAVDGLGEALRDAYSCRGIQTRLRHVADFPLSRTKEEAIQWFEGSPAFRDVHSAGHLSNSDYNKNYVKSNEATSGGLKGSKTAEGKENATTSSNKKKNKENEEPEETHSSYGTTQVSILTVREVPVMSPDEAQRSLMADPFGGFGSIAPAGMLNPFGSIFGGFFGAGSGSPSDPSSSNNNMPNMMSGSRSVSSSTRMTRDDNGKRVATTITKTTVVDGSGKKRTETETTVRHLDEGGRVETKKVVHVDGGEDSSSSSSSSSAAAAAATKPHDKRRQTARTLSPRGLADNIMVPSPFMQSPPGAIVDPSAPPSPPQVAEIATDLRLGLAVTDGTSSDPDNPNQVVRKSSGSGGWRKTEYLFRLGRFVPPFMVVSQYYEDKEEEDRRRKELTKEYNERRQRQKESRWGKSSERQQEEKSNGGSDDDNPESEGMSTFPIPANFPIDTSRIEYFLQRLDTQMEKNAAMMGIMMKQIFKPDFPKKVRISGERILENMGPTAERTGKLMKDVWTMWVSSWYNGDDDGRSGGGRR
ncbi:hypothetical protein ACHAXM_004385 [Skeletonema potamos]